MMKGANQFLGGRRPVTTHAPDDARLSNILNYARRDIPTKIWIKFADATTASGISVVHALQTMPEMYIENAAIVERPAPRSNNPQQQQ